MDRLERLEAKVDQLIDRQADQNATLSANTVSLQEHMKRSDALESIVLPMKQKWDMAEGALKLVGIIATVVGIIAGLVELAQFIIKGLA